MSQERPRILLLVDYRRGSHDIAAHALQETLGDLYEFEIAYGDDTLDVTGRDIHLSLIHI